MTDSEDSNIEKAHPPRQVIKRNGDVIDFNPEKITNAITKAMNRLEEEHRTDPNHITNQVIDSFIDDEDDVVDVDTIHKLVENTLMDNKCYEIARSYITYRENHKPNIFRERIFYKPFEYPELSQFVDAIEQSYWIVTEFNFTSDINDYKTNLTIEEKECIRRSMLAISQIEVAVKEFWGKIGDKFPKPEIQEVGATIAENEVRHSRAYSHLLELLGLNNEFEHVFKIPSINKRIDVTQRALKDKNCSDKDFIRSLVLFSIIVENVSLFSQFLIISTINKEKAALKGMTNVVSATSLEEDLHFKFGAALINTIRKEHPEMFDDELDKIVRETVEQSYEAEKEIIHWIFDQGELDYLSIDDVIEYIKNRYNRGMKECGFNPLFPVNDNKLEKTKWFDIQNTVTMHTDFFDKRPVNYSKFSSSFDEDSLF
ncbi:rNDP reductase beta subunit-like protein [Salicola phage SCTP-2]|nr:rNDP reductase beta subunit-like protein [Salicola phage SCTP-2]